MKDTIDLKQYLTKENIIITLLYFLLCILVFCTAYYLGWQKAMVIASERCEEFINQTVTYWW